MKETGLTIIVITFASLAFLVTLVHSPTTADARYSHSNSQAQSLVNECSSEGESSGINCANNGPLMQGEGLASSPVVTQSGSGQGEQGPPGPPGLQGPPGEQGPPGPDKELQVRFQFGEFITVPPGEQPVSSAECESDEVASGGGYQYIESFGSNEANPSVITAGSGNEWFLSVFNPGPNPVNIQSFAQCAKLVDAS